MKIFSSIRIDNYEVHIEIGERALAALTAVNGTKYELGNSAELLYIASGASDDYAVSVGSKHAFTVELPGGGTEGFDIEAYRISGIVAETWPALREVGSFVNEKYGK